MKNFCNCVENEDVCTLCRLDVGYTESRNVKTIAKNSNKSGLSNVASMTLACLRHFRHNHPTEWDALMKADKELVMVNLWDYLKEQQQS